MQHVRVLGSFSFVAFLLATSRAAEEVEPENSRNQRQAQWFAPVSTNWPFYDEYPSQEVYQLRSLPREPVSYGFNQNTLKYDDSEGRLGFGLLNGNVYATTRPVIGFLNSLPVIRNPNFPTLQSLLNSYDSCKATTEESGVCIPGFACSAYGGRSGGSCPLGVCCINVVSTCNGQMTLNNTYWETPSTGIARAATCSLTVKLDQRLIEQKKSPICQVRLDFVSFTIEQPGTDSVCSKDDFSVRGASNTVPSICGDNAGQHMYIHVPNSGITATDLKLVFNLRSTGTVAPTWKIKVSLLPCGAKYLAPDNCLQYFTSAEGTVQSFNWKDVTGSTRQLADQNYRVCFRTELISGVSAKTMRFSACTATETGFSLTGATPMTSQAYDPPCISDYVIIAGGRNAGNTLVLDRFCGTAFSVGDGDSPSSDVYSDLKPFALNYVTDKDESTGTSDTANIGFCFNYVETA